MVATKKLDHQGDNCTITLDAGSGYDITTGALIASNENVIQSKCGSSRPENIVYTDDASFISKRSVWSDNHRQQIFRALAWLTATCLLVYSHFQLVYILGPTDREDDYWVQFAKVAESHKVGLITYSAVIAGVTFLAAMLVATIVIHHYKEPRFRMLLPPFLFHLCLLDLLIPVMALARQVYGIFYIELGEDDGLTVVALVCESTVLLGMLYALLTRIRVMYAIYARGEYDVEYHWTLLRVVLQYGIFHLFYLAYLGPSNVHWLTNVGLRIAGVLIVLESCYYMVVLRKTRYDIKNFAQLIYIWVYAFIIFIVVGIGLPQLHPVAHSTDQYNATIVILWGINLEILGPALWHTFRTSVNWEVQPVESQSSATARDKLKAVMADAALYPIMLNCAQKQFCDENIVFLHDGYPLLRAIESGDVESATTETELECRIREFLETYVVRGTHSLVNLSSIHISRFRQVYASLRPGSQDGLESVKCKLQLVLAQSLNEVSDLITSSGVVTMYDNSPEKKSILLERSAVKRLEHRDK